MVFHANDSSRTFSRHASHDFFGRRIRQCRAAESQKFNPLEKWTALWRAIHVQAISTAQKRGPWKASICIPAVWTSRPNPPPILPSEFSEKFQLSFGKGDVLSQFRTFYLLRVMRSQRVDGKKNRLGSVNLLKSFLAACKILNAARTLRDLLLLRKHEVAVSFARGKFNLNILLYSLF